MQERLPFFAELEASQRASVALVVQTAVVQLRRVDGRPGSNVNYTARAFELMPQDLTRRIALRHSVDMLRVTMEFFEEVVPLVARSEEQLTALTVGILKYSRDLAFSAATAYADAAEARGTWDSRMEASVVDAVVRGDTGPGAAVPGGRAELGHHRAGDGGGGNPPPAAAEQRASERPAKIVRDIAARHGRAALTDVHGTWLVAIVSGQLSPTEKFLRRPAGGLLRRSGGDRADGADADRGLSQRQRGDLRDERRRRLAAGRRGPCWRASCCPNAP